MYPGSSSLRTSHRQVRYLSWFFFFRHPHKCVINLWHQVLEIHHAMADISIAHIMPKGPRKRSHSLRGVESNDPNDAAIELVTRWVLLGLNKPESRARAMVHFSLCEGSNRFLQKMKSFPIVKIMLLNSILSSYYVSHPSIIVAAPFRRPPWSLRT